MENKKYDLACYGGLELSQDLSGGRNQSVKETVSRLSVEEISAYCMAMNTDTVEETREALEQYLMDGGSLDDLK